MAMGQAGAAGALSGVLDQAVGFGFGAASGSMYRKQVRYLRRREYQDMMYSMRKAGLNPILAAGATPGHSAAYQYQPKAMDTAGGTAKFAEASLADPKARELVARKNKELEDAGVSAAQAAVLRETPANVRADTDLKRASADKASQDTATSAAQEIRTLKDAGLLEMTAKEVEARLEGIRADNIARNQDAGIYSGTEGTILRRINAWSGAIQGVDKGAGVSSARRAAGRR